EAKSQVMSELFLGACSLDIRRGFRFCDDAWRYWRGDLVIVGRPVPLHPVHRCAAGLFCWVAAGFLGVFS
ncbi:unnamed protein product, partial [Symbiodinium sp. KB8]